MFGKVVSIHLNGKYCFVEFAESGSVGKCLKQSAAVADKLGGGRVMSACAHWEKVVKGRETCREVLEGVVEQEKDCLRKKSVVEVSLFVNAEMSVDQLKLLLLGLGVQCHFVSKLLKGKRVVFWVVVDIRRDALVAGMQRFADRFRMVERVGEVSGEERDEFMANLERNRKAKKVAKKAKTEQVVKLVKKIRKSNRKIKSRLINHK